MYWTLFFIVQNADRAFGSRANFSDSLVPSWVSLGGSWIVFWCVWDPGGVTVATFVGHHFGFILGISPDKGKPIGRSKWLRARELKS